MFTRSLLLLVSLTLITAPAHAASNPAEIPQSAESSFLSGWSLEATGGGIPSSFVKARGRLGVMLAPYLEGGLQVGGNWIGTSTQTTNDPFGPFDVSYTPNISVGLDVRCYPWTTQYAFQPFLGVGIDLIGKDRLFDNAALTVGSHWLFTQNLGLTAKVGLGVRYGLDPSLGIRYRF